MNFKQKTFALLLSLITIFSSCSKEDEIFENQETQITLSDFSKNHLDISKQLIKLINKKENKVILSKISENDIYSVKNVSELTNFYTDKEFKDVNEYFNLLKEIEMNYSNFLNSNYEFKKLSLEEKQTLVSSSLTADIDLDINSYAKRGRTCREQYNVDYDRCDRNQVIGLAFSFIGGVFTGGVGGFIGAAASTVNFINCQNDAVSDFQACEN